MDSARLARNKTTPSLTTCDVLVTCVELHVAICLLQWVVLYLQCAYNDSYRSCMNGMLVAPPSSIHMTNYEVSARLHVSPHVTGSVPVAPPGGDSICLESAATDVWELPRERLHCLEQAQTSCDRTIGCRLRCLSL